MDSKIPGKAKRTGVGFPYDFFAALTKGDDDGAMACLRAEAIPDGEIPSPRAEALIKSGEWDTFQKLSLVYIEADACAGKVGNDGYRFCGKPRNFCKVGTHTKNVIGKLIRGWYVACHGKTQGVFTSPFLPAVEDGGPIRAGAAARLVDGENPFKLTRGQWRFVIDSWYAANADDPSDASSVSTNPASGNPKNDLQTFETTQASGVETSIFDFTDVSRALRESTNQAFTFASDNMGESVKSVKVDNENSSDQRLLFLEQQVKVLLEVNRKNELVKSEYESRIANVESALAQKTRQLEHEREVTLQGLQTLHDRLQPIERSLGGDIHNRGMSQEQQDKLDEVVQAVFGPQGPLENLKLQFSQFKDKLESDGGVTCNGVTFASKRELLNWFDTKQPPVEIFMDALAYLHGIRSPVVYQEEATRQREAQIKTNMTNQLQVAVFTSFDTIIPSVLVGGKRMADAGGGSIFNWLESNIKTFEDWKPKGGQTHGVSHTITNGVGRVTDNANELRNMQTDDAQAILLSVGLCTDSANFCNELVRFISDQHEALTTNSIVPEKQVWKMLLECLQKIIEELSEARGRVAAAAHFNHGYYLWGMLNAWKVQKRYMSNNFKDDPALNGIIMRRIIYHGQDSSLKDGFAKMDQLSNKVDEHRRQEAAELKKLKDAIAELKKKKNNNNNRNGNQNNNNNNNDELE